MTIGVPREIKNNENRVAITPAGVDALARAGHRIVIEAGAGLGSGISDEDFRTAGAAILPVADDVFDAADLIVKVKEPIGPEFARLRVGQSLFTYLHLAANPALTRVLLEKSITGIAYETVQLANGTLPLLAPMSEVAGRLSVQVGANLLLKYNGGAGILPGGVPGVPPAEVVIIGGGVVGTNAARIAVGLGARVTILDVNRARLSQLDEIFGGRVSTQIYNSFHAAEAVAKADLLVGAVLVAGAKAPKVVTTSMVQSMKPGSVIVDVAIDQGGSIETIDRITTHDNPSYEKFGVVHYSVANMPGSVPRTSTFALMGATLPYLLQLANLGPFAALKADKSLLAGLNTFQGRITCLAVARAQDASFSDAAPLLMGIAGPPPEA